MAHLRQQIRDAVTTAVTGLTTTGSNVFNLGVKPIQENQLPALLVHTPSDVANYEDGSMGCAPRHELELHIVGKYKGATQATLDTIAAEVETALYTDETLGGIAEGIELSSQEIDIEDEADKLIGSIDMIFTVYYRAAEGAPEVTT